jgi:ribonuclease HII
MTHPKTHPKRPDLSYEHRLLASGLEFIAGLDEAGRGAWAGPVVAAAVILPMQQFDLLNLLDGVRDSKLMTARQREYWHEKICSIALSSAIGACNSNEIDQIGIVPATQLAMQRALEQIHPAPEHLLIDYITLPDLSTPQTAIPHGDARVLSIAAASVLAKVGRDRIMVTFDENYPGYGFSRHKGYGTAFHRTELNQLGACDIHRRSYKPVAQALEKQIANGRP